MSQARVAVFADPLGTRYSRSESYNRRRVHISYITKHDTASDVLISELPRLCEPCHLLSTITDTNPAFESLRNLEYALFRLTRQESTFAPRACLRVKELRPRRLRLDSIFFYLLNT